MTAVENARAVDREWSLGEVAGLEAENQLVYALRDLITEHERVASAAHKAADLIGNQAGDITGAALDAWVILSDALADRTEGEAP